MKKLAPLFFKLAAVCLAVWLLSISIIPEIYNEPEVDDTEVVQAKPVDPKQLQCMAENIYYEAKNEPIEGQAAVARVVMNRVKHGFAPTPCNVIYQVSYVTKINEDTLDEYRVRLCQFSWVCEGKGKPNPNDPHFKRAVEIAHDVLAYDAYQDVLPKSALFFHNLTVDPLWPYKQVAKIGNHIFYSKTKKPTNKNKTTKNNI
jgi:spore germination cell wall hydrolase CwlJ-like protein